MDKPTKYPELNHVLGEFVQRLKTILEDHLLAVYLQGSFALGAGDEDSDVDFLVVLDEELSDELLPQLEAMHRRLFEIPVYWSQHLEGSYFPKKILMEANNNSPVIYIDNGSKVLERSAHDNELVVRWLTREHGISLYGADAKTYIKPVPVDALKREIINTMQDWGGEIVRGDYTINNVWAQSFAVIMYCRMLQTLETGAINSKPAAVTWAQNHLNAEWHPLIHKAWQKRANQYQKITEPADADDISRSIEFIQYALKLSEAYQE